MDIKNIFGTVVFTSALTVIKDVVIEAIKANAYLHGADLSGAYLSGAYLRDADLRDADLRGAYLSGADLSGKKIHSLRSFSSSLYPHQVWAVQFQGGSRMVRMGCLYKTLEEWENYPILKSNISEFPDDGSEKSLDRAAMFELAKACALRMTLPTDNPPANGDLEKSCSAVECPPQST